MPLTFQVVAIGGEEALGVAGRFESLHPSCPLLRSAILVMLSLKQVKQKL